MLFYVCVQCGAYSEEKRIEPEGPFAICPYCDYQQLFVLSPLFVVSGPSGAGKTAICLELARRTSECICLEMDILWRGEFDNPVNDYRNFRETWLRMALNISQSGIPVALFGSTEPRQWEVCTARRYFSEIHYLALVCDEEVLAARLRARPAWRESGTPHFIDRMLEYNSWLKHHAADAQPTMTLLDTSHFSLDESVQYVSEWIRNTLRCSLTTG